MGDQQAPGILLCVGKVREEEAEGGVPLPLLFHIWPHLFAIFGVGGCVTVSQESLALLERHSFEQFVGGVGGGWVSGSPESQALPGRSNVCMFVPMAGANADPITTEHHRSEHHRLSGGWEGGRGAHLKLDTPHPDVAHRVRFRRTIRAVREGEVYQPPPQTETLFVRAKSTPHWEGWATAGRFADQPLSP